MQKTIIPFLLRYSPFILMGMAFIQLLAFWPGELTPDSIGQYAMATSGQYSDHHPPIMSLVWRYLDMIVKGPGLMMVLQLTLLYTGLYFAIKSLGNHPKRYLMLLYPLVPSLLIYTHYIWKDVAFAYSFVCVAGVLAWVGSRPVPHNRLSIKLAIPLFIILYYGTAVKYQAQFVAPIFIFWMIYLMLRPMRSLKIWLLVSGLVTCCFLTAMLNINKELTKEAGQLHSWQLVKLYDLAAMSVALDKPLFPEANMTEHFSMERLHKEFSQDDIVPLAFPENAILQKGKTEEDRDILWSTWAKEILNHPVAYLKHRFSNLAFVLLSTPGLNVYLDLIDHVAEKDSVTYKALYYVGRVGGYLVMAHILTVLLCLAYLALGLATLRKTWAALPLVFCNAVGFGMVILLLFLSMAGTPRYTYITICMVHLSHFWAYLCYQAYKGKKAVGSKTAVAMSVA